MDRGLARFMLFKIYSEAVKRNPAPPSPDAGTAPIRVGVSACLLGQRVRWDGGHKSDSFLIGTLGRYVEWVPVCPEVEVGLPVPRDTLRLVRRGEEVRMVMPRTGADNTRAMRAYAAQRVRALAALDLCGFVLKKDSPSCGMTRVRVYPEAGGAATRDGRGLFAEELIRQMPHLPIEEEGRLLDRRLRENFVERLFAYRRLKSLFAARWRLADLLAFHSAHKLLLMAHSPAAYARLGRLVAMAKKEPRESLRQHYEGEFMAALTVLATPGRHANVLHHMLGYVSPALDRDQRAEIDQLIDDYRRDLAPLLAPLTLLRHHVRRLGIGYLLGQVYLEPSPKELMLRNHA
jgi:uncharacterized protein YbgA (DUF1722 family)/uncharacterized protein YbbK (DUF523 family)